MESLELSFQQALNRERILLEQLAVNAENTSQLENRVRELSQEILHVQENNSKIVKENEELKDVLTQTKEEFELVKAAEQVHKTIEIQELNSAHEQELSYVNSRFSQAVEKNFQLNNQIAELERSIISLKNEKKLNDMALAKLEEVISLLDERLPEIEHISDDNQTVNSNPEIKKRRRFLRENN
jgi:chromosome segregation ATPase